MDDTIKYRKSKYFAFKLNTTKNVRQEVTYEVYHRDFQEDDWFPGVEPKSKRSFHYNFLGEIADDTIGKIRTIDEREASDRVMRDVGDRIVRARVNQIKGVFYVSSIDFIRPGLYTMRFLIRKSVRVDRVVVAVPTVPKSVLRTISRNEDHLQREEHAIYSDLHHGDYQKDNGCSGAKNVSKTGKCAGSRGRKKISPKRLLVRNESPRKKKRKGGRRASSYETSHLFQGFKANETVVLFSRVALRRELLYFCTDGARGTEHAG